MASEPPDTRIPQDTFGTDALARSHSELSEAERMLQDAVAALDSTPMAMHDVGLRPMEFEDWTDSFGGESKDTKRCGVPSEAVGLGVDRDTRGGRNSDERELRIEFARFSLDATRLMQLGSGQVLTTEVLSQAPVDIWVGERCIGRGEVLVLDGKLCIQVTELITASEPC